MPRPVGTLSLLRLFQLPWQMESLSSSAIPPSVLVVLLQSVFCQAHTNTPQSQSRRVPRHEARTYESEHKMETPLYSDCITKRSLRCHSTIVIHAQTGISVRDIGKVMGCTYLPIILGVTFCRESQFIHCHHSTIRRENTSNYPDMHAATTAVEFNHG